MAAVPTPQDAIAGPGAARLDHPLTRLLLVLTALTGLVDAVTYLGLGRVFAANMTGNVVLLGFGLAGGQGLPVLAPLASLACFLAGAALGGRLVRRAGDRRPQHVVVTLGAETALLLAATVVAGSVHVRPGHVEAGVVIALLAAAMGIRNATARRLGVPDLTTTVLTLTLTGLAADSPAGGGDGRGTARRLAAATAMLLGALAGALLVRAGLVVCLAVSTALTALAVGAYARAVDGR